MTSFSTKDTNGAEYTIELSDLSSHKHFWQEDSDSNFAAVQTTLDNQVINQCFRLGNTPCLNAAGEAVNISPQDQAIGAGSYHKVEHGVSKAMQRSTLAKAMLKQATEHGKNINNPSIDLRQVANQWHNDRQKLAGLQLAAYCLDIARCSATEEQSSSQQRSAELFAQIATDLGFDAELIEDLKIAMGHAVLDNNHARHGQQRLLRALLHSIAYSEELCRNNGLNAEQQREYEQKIEQQLISISNDHKTFANSLKGTNHATNAACGNFSAALAQPARNSVRQDNSKLLATLNNEQTMRTIETAAAQIRFDSAQRGFDVQFLSNSDNPYFTTNFADDVTFYKVEKDKTTPLDVNSMGERIQTGKYKVEQKGDNAKKWHFQVEKNNGSLNTFAPGNEEAVIKALEFLLRATDKTDIFLKPPPEAGLPKNLNNANFVARLDAMCRAQAKPWYVWLELPSRTLTLPGLDPVLAPIDSDGSGITETPGLFF